MFERFTERARQVVLHAQDVARDERINYIGPEQILLGLLAEEEGLAAKVLTHLGVTFDKAAVGANARITGRVREDKELQGQIPFTQGAKDVLEGALRRALSLGHNYIGTEHILLSLVHRENVAGEILRDDFSLTSEKVRDEVIRMLSGPKAPILKEPRSYQNLTPTHLEAKLSKYEKDLRPLLDMAVHLGRLYPDVPSTRIVNAVLALHENE